jgi:gluconate 5-dehydrogenase
MSLEKLFSLSGKKALIAGASRGIGLAIAKATAAAGAHTVLAARSQQALATEAGALIKAGYKAETLSLDVTSEQSIDAAAEAHGDIDILVNVAGTNIRKRFEQYTQEEYERIMQTNLHGIVRLTQKVGAKMVARGSGGKIVHIGSLTSLLGLPYLAVYTMTKSAGGVDAYDRGGMGAVQHSGELHRARLHPYRFEPQDVAAAGDARVDEGRAAQPTARHTRGHRRPLGVSEWTGFGLHHRADHCLRRRLFDLRQLAVHALARPGQRARTPLSDVFA